MRFFRLFVKAIGNAKAFGSVNIIYEVNILKYVWAGVFFRISFLGLAHNFFLPETEATAALPQGRRQRSIFYIT